MANTRTLDDLRAHHTAHLRAGNRSERTISHYDDSFKDLYKWLDAESLPRTINSLTTQSCQRYVAWLRETPIKLWRDSTARSIFGVAGRVRDLAVFLNFLTREGLLERRITLPQMKLPSRDFSVFSEDELVAIFTAPHLASRGNQAVRNRAIVALLLDTGIRLAEITSLQPEDILWGDNLLRIVAGKGGKMRHVAYSEGALAYLKDWRRVRGDDPGTFFLLSYDGIRQLLRRIALETGIHVHPHRFRHSFASTMIRRGARVETVQKLLGHSSIAMTLRYVHQSTAELREKHNAASPLDAITALLPQTNKPKRRRLSLDDVA